MAEICVIGSGFAGLSAAAFARSFGHKVSVLEQHAGVGGRAGAFSAERFLFDKGPSWYWMPDVFENFFEYFGKKPEDYFELKKLDPGFQMIFGKDEVLPVPADYEEIRKIFETIEAGSAERLDAFLSDAEFKYSMGMQRLVYKPSLSVTEFLDPSFLLHLGKTDLFTSVRKHVAKYFKDERLQRLMEFPVIFLGAMPDKIPALYTLMNFAAVKQGTFYPQGGMIRLVHAMRDLCLELGVDIRTETKVRKITVEQGRASGIKTSAGNFAADAVIAAADYRFVEQHLLDEANRNYPANYWHTRTFAPSCLLFYVGLNTKLPRLQHHNLFFDTDFDVHAEAIYGEKNWPEKPLFYACCPSKTDESVAPAGMENLFLLVPLANGLEDSEALREACFEKLEARLAEFTGLPVGAHIVYKKSYCISDFERDFGAYGGNAYGLANTLKQTALLKPSLRNKKVNNLFYAGQLTVPGPGVPPSIISGRLAAEQANKHLYKSKHYEALL